MGLGWPELLVILAIVVIIFGGAKLAGVGKASGRAIREFRDELKGSDAASVTTPPVDAASSTTAPGQTAGH